MTEANIQTDSIVFSNVTLVRDQDGNLSVWVGNQKMMGVGPVTLANGALSLAMPITRVRLAEDVPATPVIVDSSNVIMFPKLRAVQLEDAPTVDGDSR